MTYWLIFENNSYFFRHISISFTGSYSKQYFSWWSSYWNLCWYDGSTMGSSANWDGCCCYFCFRICISDSKQIIVELVLVFNSMTYSSTKFSSMITDFFLFLTANSLLKIEDSWYMWCSQPSWNASSYGWSHRSYTGSPCGWSNIWSKVNFYISNFKDWN